MRRTCRFVSGCKASASRGAADKREAPQWTSEMEKNASETLREREEG